MSSFIKLSYSFVAFLSAFLLFWIQPLVSKYFTPILGGSPMVWNTLLFLFQLLLLIGYGYVAFISKKLSNNLFLIIHFIAAATVITFLPVSFESLSNAPNNEFPVLWLIQQVFWSIGVPFFFLATTAPLLQIWYFKTFKNTQNKEAYFLYAISNLGSFGALFIFLWLIEPSWTTSDQILIWSRAMMIMMFFLVLCGGFLFLKNSKKQESIKKTKETETTSPSPLWSQKIKWLALAFVPGSLLHGITVYITNDLLSLPIFWVVPLGLYLLTFVITFSPLGGKIHRYIRYAALPAAFIPILLLFWSDPLFNLTLFALHMVMFVILSLACHGELYKQRPPEENLGSFYLWIAAGGALAGFFNVIIAPLTFDMIFEYPLSIAAAIFILIFIRQPLGNLSKSNIIKSILFPLLTAIGIFLFYKNIPNIFSTENSSPFPQMDNLTLSVTSILLLSVLSFLILGYIFTFRKQALNLGLFFLSLHFVTSTTTSHSLFGFLNTDPLSNRETLFISRNFYGVIRVIDTYDNGYGLRKYYNGAGAHSGRVIDTIPSLSTQGSGGYRSRMIGEAQGRNLPVAILGMGPARYQCFRKDSQPLEYFEINPDVVKMAEDPNIFGFLHHCGGNYKVHIGDARLELSKQEDQKYGAILSTLYWSSTVPFHLFTKEALDMYVSKLADDGYFSIIIPNHFFDFAPLFSSYNAQSPYKFHIIQEAGNPFFRTFIIQKTIDGITPNNWEALPENSDIPLWTDDFYNIWDVLKNPKNMRLTRDKKRFDFL
jgi:hypothetical protein